MASCLICKCEASQCKTTNLRKQGYQGLWGFFFFLTPAANILLRDLEPTAVPRSGRLNVLFTPSGCVRVVCFGFAAALVFGF